VWNMSLDNIANTNFTVFSAVFYRYSDSWMCVVLVNLIILPLIIKLIG
jgi:hypothetical protein